MKTVIILIFYFILFYFLLIGWFYFRKGYVVTLLRCYVGEAPFLEDSPDGPQFN